MFVPETVKFNGIEVELHVLMECAYYNYIREGCEYFYS